MHSSGEQTTAAPDRQARNTPGLIFTKSPGSFPPCPCTSSSAVERSAYTGLVGGSIPSSCTSFFLDRRPVCAKFCCAGEVEVPCPT